MDVLGDVLSALELSAWPWFRAELGHPFAVAVPDTSGQTAGAIRFHVAGAGHCVVEVAGQAPLRFGAGDLVLVPGGAAHVLSDAPGREAVPLETAIASSGYGGDGPLVLGDAPPRTTLVCGEFRFGDPGLHPFLASLPPLLHAAAHDSAGYGWIEQVLRHLERESQGRQTGHTAVIRRLAEILLIEVLRARQDETGALSALADPQLARVLAALHAEPEADWSLERMARAGGMSRTLLAERFRERLGVPPMRYLATWRLQKARALLAAGALPVGDLARRVGYASESAFSRAFREQFGAPPGAFRRQRDASRSGPA